MLLEERKLRAQLRLEAARPLVPRDMWQQISSQLDQDVLKRNRSSLWGMIPPAIGLCVVASVFWLTLISASQYGGEQPGQTVSIGRPSTRAGAFAGQPVSQQVLPVRYELGPETTVAMASTVPLDGYSQRLGQVTR